MHKKRQLSKKKELFAIEYIKDCNATQAAIRAGYARSTALSRGNDFLNEPEIMEKITELQESVKSEAIADYQELCEFYTKVLRTNITDYGKPDFPEEVIQEIHETYRGQDIHRKIKAYSKMDAASRLSEIRPDIRKHKDQDEKKDITINIVDVSNNKQINVEER